MDHGLTRNGRETGPIVPPYCRNSCKDDKGEEDCRYDSSLDKFSLQDLQREGYRIIFIHYLQWLVLIILLYGAWTITISTPKMHFFISTRGILSMKSDEYIVLSECETFLMFTIYYRFRLVACISRVTLAPSPSAIRLMYHLFRHFPGLHQSAYPTLALLDIMNFHSILSYL